MKLKELFSKKKKYFSKPFVIAEIGHNHKGSLEIAKKMFFAAKECGADAVKLQKRSNKDLFTNEMYNQTYDHPNSYGKTYGKHRDYLELNKKEFLILKKLARKLDIEFICTPFDFESVNFLKDIGVDAYKIASADLINTPLQEYLAKQKKPIFLSTGGGNYSDIERAYKSISKINKQLAILHCTASYPASIEDMNLNVIKVLKKKYKNKIIGLSDHENGIDAASVAFMLGARIFEKHFTLDRSWKGTDHSISLEPQGLKKMIRNLNRISIMLGSNQKKLLKSEIAPLRKMQKSLVASKDLKKGTKLKKKDISIKSPGGGMKPYEFKNLLNKVLTKNLGKDEQFKKNVLK